jgi:hypothetical protein
MQYIKTASLAPASRSQHHRSPSCISQNCFLLCAVKNAVKRSCSDTAVTKQSTAIMVSFYVQEYCILRLKFGIALRSATNSVILDISMRLIFIKEIRRGSSFVAIAEISLCMQKHGDNQFLYLV